MAIGATPYSFGEWSIPMEAGTPEISNFTTAPYRAYVSGLVGATVDCSMPGYNQGNSPLTVGNTYSLTLGWTSLINLAVSGILKKLTADDKVDGAPSLKCTFQITGSFTAAVT